MPGPDQDAPADPGRPADSAPPPLPTRTPHRAHRPPAPSGPSLGPPEEEPTPAPVHVDAPPPVPAGNGVEAAPAAPEPPPDGSVRSLSEGGGAEAAARTDEIRPQAGPLTAGEGESGAAVIDDAPGLEPIEASAPGGSVVEPAPAGVANAGEPSPGPVAHTPLPVRRAGHGETAASAPVRAAAPAR
jgi:hypothetical protein